VTIPAWDVEAFVQIACGFVAVIGHMMPVFAGFKGGKGGATAAGMLYGIEPVSISISVGIFLLTMITTRYVSLGTIVSTASYPLSQLVLRYIVGWPIDGSIMILSSFAALFIIYKHKDNIQRLRAGTERRIKTFKPSMGELSKSDTGTSGDESSPSSSP
jgi:glycerol-3-phosphate acyltransferase PlsY